MSRTCRRTKQPLGRRRNQNAPNLLIFEKCKKTLIEHASKMQSERWIRFKAGNGTLENQPVIGSVRQGNWKARNISRFQLVRRVPFLLGMALRPKR